MRKAVVLGCGAIGRTIAADLCADPGFDVTVADASRESLDSLGSLPARRVHRDLADPAQVKATVSEFDVVLGALPSTLGFQALRAVIESGKPYADISFMPEDYFELDGEARKRGVTVVVDCGVAPGLANMLVGRCASRLDRTERVVCYAGGLPRKRTWPYEYKAPFSPHDVLELYTRPARVIEGGRLVAKPALSDPELIDFPEAGTLEAFNTDGLRSLLRTVTADFMQEKTLRYPGHRALMEVLRETGFLGREPLDIDGTRIAPVDVTTRLLFPLWKPEAGEADFTALRVVVEGTKASERRRYVCDLFDRNDAAAGATSMARTTAFPCTIAARMLADGSLRGPGVLPPEEIGRRPALMDRVLEQLAARGVMIRERLS